MTVSATFAVEGDPFLLRRPGGDDLVVAPERISPSNTFPNCRYDDVIWYLAPLIDNPGTVKARLSWRKSPVVFVDELKQITWNMINGELRPTYLQNRGKRARARAPAKSLSVRF